MTHRPAPAHQDLYTQGDGGDLEQLAARYCRGESIQTLAHGLTVSASTVRRRLLAAGVTLRLAGTPRRRPDTDTLRQHLKDGLTPTQIAEQYRVSASAVSNWLTRTGLRREPPVRPTRAELADLYQRDQRSAVDIARRYDVTPTTVYSWLRKADIPAHTAANRESKNEASRVVRALYEEQLTFGAIARLVGCSTSTVARTLDRQHVPRRRPQPRLEPQAVRDAITAGCSAADIAHACGTATSTVYRTLQRHGIDNPTTARQRSTANALQQLNTALERICWNDNTPLDQPPSLSSVECADVDLDSQRRQPRRPSEDPRP